MKEKIILFTDGGSRGNPGPAGAGVVISQGSGRILKKLSRSLGVMTNNEAEYQAALFGLSALKKIFGKGKIKNLDVEIKLDSDLVASQLRGEYRIKEERLFPLFIKIWNLRVANFPQLTFTHIPREQNKLADELANEAMDEAAQKQDVPSLFPS
jgi:ribonuclease HI